MIKNIDTLMAVGTIKGYHVNDVVSLLLFIVLSLCNVVTLCTVVSI